MMWIGRDGESAGGSLRSAKGAQHDCGGKGTPRVSEGVSIYRFRRRNVYKCAPRLRGCLKLGNALSASVARARGGVPQYQRCEKCVSDTLPHLRGVSRSQTSSSSGTESAPHVSGGVPYWE